MDKRVFSAGSLGDLVGILFGRRVTKIEVVVELDFASILQTVVDMPDH